MMKFGSKNRPVGRYVPRVILDRFDIMADWLDIELFSMRGQKIERWELAHIICCILSCVVYAQWVGWFYAFTIGPLVYALGWMGFTWRIIF
jgi:hypothetical protein